MDQEKPRPSHQHSRLLFWVVVAAIIICLAIAISLSLVKCNHNDTSANSFPTETLDVISEQESHEPASSSAAGIVEQNTATETAVLDETTRAAEAAAVAARAEAEAKVVQLVTNAAALTDEASLAVYDEALASLAPAELDATLIALEMAAEKAAKAGKPEPALRLALSLGYGRKGLETRAYAAVLTAETEAKAPGVVFSLAAIYGRKALLAPADEKPCSLRVETNPPGATVEVNGVVTGKAPLRLEGMRPGKHELSASLPGYDSLALIVEGKPGAVMIERLMLTPSAVLCAVSTDPAGAELLIDGSIVGNSPWSGALRPGKHTIEARLAGYTKETGILEPEIGGPTIDSRYTLSALPATLLVTSEPSGAQVSVDGTLMGSSPLEKVLPPGSHIVEVNAANYTLFTQKVELVAGLTEQIEAKLQTKTGKLRITAPINLPFDLLFKVRISIDEKYVGMTSKDASLEVQRISLGSHYVEASVVGYTTWTDTILISSDTNWTNIVPVLNVLASADTSRGIDRAISREPFTVKEAVIKVDGKAADWTGIQSVNAYYPDKRWNRGEPPIGVEGIYLALDAKYLYWMMRFTGKRPANMEYTLQMYDSIYSSNGDRKGCLLCSYNIQWEDHYQVVYDDWNNPTGSKKISIGGGSSREDILEMRVPRNVLKPGSFTFDLSLRWSGNSTNLGIYTINLP